MTCWIYKSPKKSEMYLYSGKENDFSAIPAALLKRFGEPVFVMELDLNTRTSLAREDIEHVRHNLEQNGFHLQMPPKLEPWLLESSDGF